MTPTVTEPTPLTYGRDPSIKKFSVEQYQRMIEEGIFDQGPRVELLEGWIVWRDAGDEPPAPARTPLTYGTDPALATFTVEQYQRMIEAGIFGPDDKVELLENWVVLKMPHGPDHDSAVQALGELLYPLQPPGWGQRTQSAIVLPDAQPEPDVAVVRGGARRYRQRHPAPADLGLVIEVAHSSLLRDRRDKTVIYSRAGIVRYWIVNLVDGCIEVYEQPSGPTADPAYASVTTHGRGTSVPLLLDGVTVATIPVDDVIG